MTRQAYRRLVWIKWVGAAILFGTIVGIWLHRVPAVAAFVLFFVFGLPAAIAAWLLREAKSEELTRG